MKSALLRFAIAAALAVPSLRAQNPAQTPAPTPVACTPTPTLDALIKALGEAVSGPADKDRTCLRALLTPDAHLVPVTKSAEGAYTPHPLTVDGWIDRVKQRGSAAFYEVQVKVKPEVYGHIAHLWSTYEIRETPNGKAQIRGINSIQAVNNGTRWQIFEILWQAETTEEQIPTKYLP